MTCITFEICNSVYYIFGVLHIWCTTFGLCNSECNTLRVLHNSEMSHATIGMRQFELRALFAQIEFERISLNVAREIDFDG